MGEGLSNRVGPASLIKRYRMRCMLAVLLAISLPCAAQISPAPVADLNSWHDLAREACAGDEDCKRIVKQFYDDAMACIGGSATACERRDANLGEIKRWNAQNRPAQARDKGGDT
jgi:hypothetical protein